MDESIKSALYAIGYVPYVAYGFFIIFPCEANLSLITWQSLIVIATSTFIIKQNKYLVP